MSGDTARAALAAYPVVIEQPLIWGDMDAFGHLNNTGYFRLFESARIAYFERIDWLELMQRSGPGPILAETRCRFRAPLTYPDTVLAAARVRSLAEDQFEMQYAVASIRLDTLAAEGDGRLVSYDYAAKRRAPLPRKVADRIRALEGLE